MIKYHTNIRENDDEIFTSFAIINIFPKVIGTNNRIHINIRYINVECHINKKGCYFMYLHNSMYFYVHNSSIVFLFLFNLWSLLINCLTYAYKFKNPYNIMLSRRMQKMQKCKKSNMPFINTFHKCLSS